MTKYVDLPYNKKLNLLREHSMGCDWPDLDQEHWCLHCGKKFNGHSVRVWQERRRLACGWNAAHPDCDGSPIDWAPYPWWNPKHPATKDYLKKAKAESKAEAQTEARHARRATRTMCRSDPQLLCQTSFASSPPRTRLSATNRSKAPAPSLSLDELLQAVRRSWTPSAGAVRTSTSGSAPCSSSTPSTASICRPSSNAASRLTHHVSRSLIPFKGYEHLLQRRFEEAIDHFLAVQQAEGPSDAISSALAAAYHRLAFQTLADQVRRSVRSVRGNQWMFRMGHPADHPLRIRPELLRPNPGDGTYPILRECTPVRMDLTHCGWSDIFFLGMDFPEGAKVLNVSIDLGVHGRDAAPRPPVEAYLRVIEEPLLRLVSVDLGASADITNLAEVFDFAKDYLGLLKAAVIAAGIVPPGIEGSGQSLAELLARMVGPGRGLEIVSSVNNIPKGSRLAVSTKLLAALVSVCMRATGQAASLTGQLQEHERRLVLARALLGEWLGGSGGGWQDSGGVWPGMKLIEGVLAGEGDPEFGISRGRLMPQHRILDQTRRLAGDAAQAAGQPGARPRRHGAECRADPGDGHREVPAALRRGVEGAPEHVGHPRRDSLRLARRRRARDRRRDHPQLPPAHPDHHSLGHELLHRDAHRAGARGVRRRASGASGCWAACPAAGWASSSRPEQKARAQERLQEIMSATKRELQARPALRHGAGGL